MREPHRRRHQVTPKIAARMRELRGQGLSTKIIAERMGFDVSTVKEHMVFTDPPGDGKYEW